MFRICPNCGSALDQEERCDCMETKKESPHASKQTGLSKKKSINKYFSTLYQRNGANANVISTT